MARDNRLQVNVALVGEFHIEDLIRLGPFTLQHVPGFGILFFRQVVPRHHFGERIVALQHRQRQNIAAILQNNALRLLRYRDRPVVHIFDRDRPVTCHRQQR